jgi:lycopene beta-cyclase
MIEPKSPFKGEGYYDFIISGAGCAGLSLLLQMIDSKKFTDKKILLVDKEEKNKNDRTWCFWESEPGLFNSIVFKQWSKLWYHDNVYSKLLEIDPYKYKMIRGIDFYNYCFDIIRMQKNIDLQFGKVENIESENQKATLTIDGKKIASDYIFNSILFKRPELKKQEYYLLQHFKGWIIETDCSFFNPGEATMMDFRMEQKGGVTFVYIMPFSETKALIEYTLFTENLLTAGNYDEALRNYINQVLKIDSYKVVDEEFGIIPMTNHRFGSAYNRVINIGTVGGQTKASTGYTFKFIQKNSAEIVSQLIRTGKPFLNKSSSRFHFYDSILLNILYHRKLSGPEIFTPIIKKNKPQDMLRFLDNESSLTEDLKIISSLPILPFLKAAIKQL